MRDEKPWSVYHLCRSNMREMPNDNDDEEKTRRPRDD